MAYCTTAKAYRLSCLNKHKIIITRDVIFDEETPTPQQWVPNPAPVPSAYSSLYPLNNSVSTDVSSSMNTEIPTSSHTLPITSASGVSLPGLQEAVGASHSDLHEAVGDNHSNLSTPSTGSPDPMLTMGLSTPRSESLQNMLPISTSGSSDTSPLPDSFNSAEIPTTNFEQSSCAQSPSPLTSTISPDNLHPVLKTRSLADI